MGVSGPSLVLFTIRSPPCDGYRGLVLLLIIVFNFGIQYWYLTLLYITWYLALVFNTGS